MEMDDQVIVLQLKITMCAQEDLLLQLIYVNYETLGTIRMIIKIPAKVIVEMASKLLKNNAMTITLTQMMAEVQHV